MKLQTQNHSEAIIIGGGIIGLACAHYLLKAGRTVRILEKSSVFSGASHGNCGLIFSSHLPPLCAPGVVLNELQRALSRNAPVRLDLKPDIKRWLWTLRFIQHGSLNQLIHAIKSREAIMRSSRLLYDELFSERPLDYDRGASGILMVFKDQEAMESYRANQWFAKNYNIRMEPLIGPRLYDLEPALKPGLYGGWHYTQDAHVRPEKLGSTWKHNLIKVGAVIEEDCLATGFEIERDRVVRLLSSKGSYTADSYILAAGAWAPQFERQLNLRLPIQPAKGYSVTMERPDNALNMPCYCYEKRVVVTPWKNGVRVGGALELTGRQFGIPNDRLNRMINDAQSYVSMNLKRGVQERWRGFRPLTTDDLPIIDRSPHQRNLFIAGGHGTTGFSMAPATGKLLSELITEKTPHINPQPYSITRFQ